MPRYVVDHEGSSVEVVTNFLSQKCGLLVGGTQWTRQQCPSFGARRNCKIREWAEWWLT